MYEKFQNAFKYARSLVLLHENFDRKKTLVNWSPQHDWQKKNWRIDHKSPNLPKFQVFCRRIHVFLLVNFIKYMCMFKHRHVRTSIQTPYSLKIAA